MTRHQPSEPERAPSESSQPPVPSTSGRPAEDFDPYKPPKAPSSASSGSPANLTPIRRACLTIVVAHIVVIVLLALTFAVRQQRGPDLPTSLLVSLAAAQCTLIAMYVGLGDDPSMLRWILLFPGWLITAGAVAIGLKEVESWPFLFTGIVMGIAVAAALAMRARHGPLRVDDASGQADVLQFGIRHLLLATTVAAMIAALIKSEIIQFGHERYLLVGAVAAVFGVGVSASFWAMLGRPSPWPWRVLAVLATSQAAGWFSALLVSNPRDWRFWYWVLMPTASAVILMATLAIVRRLGLRWTRGGAGS